MSGTYLFRDNISRLLHSMINDEYVELQNREYGNNFTNTFTINDTNNLSFSSRNLESYNISSILSDTITSFTTLIDNTLDNVFDNISIQVYTINTSDILNNNDTISSFLFNTIYNTSFSSSYSPPTISIEDINNLHKCILTESIECYICLDKLLPGSCVTQLPCTHKFCFDCIKQWLNEYNTTCPICKKDVKV
jgi:hypothetical protein